MTLYWSRRMCDCRQKPGWWELLYTVVLTFYHYSDSLLQCKNLGMFWSHSQDGVVEQFDMTDPVSKGNSIASMSQQALFLEKINGSHQIL